MRSVMAAEQARKYNKIRTDIHADRPGSAKRVGKKKKKLEAKLKTNISDSEDDISEKPSMTSKGSSRSDGSSITPRGGPAIDHHIKYSENEKLRQWLKEKNKLYRKNMKEERKKKREEREKLINEANEKLERKIESQKKVTDWMKEKHKEILIKQKEEKKKHEIENKEQEKKMAAIPGDSVQIKQHRREDDVKVEKDKCKGEKTPEYVKQQIHDKREIEEENKQADMAVKGAPHPPQTKFIYKRPVAGKIKFNMQVKGKSAPTNRSESAEREETDKEKSEKMRLSYDEWIKKKRDDDIIKRRNNAKMRESEMAQSDPELNRLIPDLAKRRIDDKLKMKKRVDTGIKSFDDKANKSFGGADFDTESSSGRPSSSYRLPADTVSDKLPKRPATAPAGRGRMPQPKESSTSPRKAIIPKKPDQIMDNKDNSNPYVLPFPPEKGVPAHVSSRQRKLFGDKAPEKSQTEQEALLQEVLIREGVADIEEARAGSASEHDEPDATDIHQVMYSRKKRKDSSESSDSDIEVKNEEKVDDSKEQTDTAEPAHIDSFGSVEGENVINETELNEKDMNTEVQSNGQYRTYENLNDLPLDSPKGDNDNSSVGADLGIDIEKLREQVDALQVESTGPPLLYFNDPRDSFESRSTDEEDSNHETEPHTITIISDNDPNVVGILKESKRMDNMPLPEHSDEMPEKSSKTVDENNESTQLNPEDSVNASKKRVSFNEQTEVFQSIDSSSTDTITPEQADFDPDAESLDAQPYYVDEQEDGDNNYGAEDSNPDMKPEGETLSFNIAGFQLNPTVLSPDAEDEAKEDQPTFITNPDTD